MGKTKNIRKENKEKSSFFFPIAWMRIENKEKENEKCFFFLFGWRK